MLEWNTQTKRKGTCGSCPFKSDQCILKGLEPARDAPYNLIFVLESPPKGSERCGQAVVAGEELTTLLSVIEHAVSNTYSSKLSYGVTFAVAATDHYDAEPPAGAVTACGPYLMDKLAATAARPAVKARGKVAPNVIIAFGARAASAVSVTGQGIKKLRGKHVRVMLGSDSWLVVPTLSLRQLFVQPNLVDQVAQDVVSGLAAIMKDYVPLGIEELSSEYVFPTTLPEVRDLVDHIIAYSAGETAPDQWPIAVDLETTGLRAYEPGARILMASAAWDERKSCAIPLYHREVPYDPALAAAEVGRLWACAKPKVGHNIKFDIRWGRLLNWQLENLWMDTMLAEHFANEGAKGFYSLKALAMKYALNYAGYEGQLHQLLLGAINDINASLVVDYPTAISRDIWLPSPDYDQLEARYVELTLRSGLLEKADPTLPELKKERTRAWNKIKRGYEKIGEPWPAPAKLDKAKVTETTKMYENVPIMVLSRYAAVDTDLTLLLSARILNRLERTEGAAAAKSCRTVMRHLAVPATHTLARMEHRGMRMNLALVDKYEAEIQAVYDRYFERAQALALIPDFGPNKPKDIARVLLSVYLVPEAEIPMTEAGNASTTKEVLRGLRRKYAGTDVGMFCHCVLVCRTASKALKTYLLGFREAARYDGRVHTSFNLHGTVTARLSSSNPNFQNVPSYLVSEKYEGDDGVVIDSLPGWPIKALFLPSDDTYWIFDMDISAAEIRVLCAFLQRGPLVDAVNAGLGIPSFVCSRIDKFAREIWKERMGEDPDVAPDVDRVYAYIEAHKEEDKFISFRRTAAKRVLYGLLYGAGVRKLAEQIYGALSLDEAVRDAQIGFAAEVRDGIFAMFPEIKEYIDDTIAAVLRDRYALSLFGRRRRFPMLHFASPKSKYGADAKRESVNFRIQSSASDLVLAQLIEVENNIEEIGGRVELTVHDSIVGEIRKDKAHLLLDFLLYWVTERVRQRFPWMPVAFAFDAKIGPSYGETIPLADIHGDAAGHKLSEAQVALFTRHGLDLSRFEPRGLAPDKNLDAGPDRVDEDEDEEVDDDEE